MARVHTIIAVLLLLSAAAPAVASHSAIERQRGEPGWMVDRFTMTGDKVTVVIGTVATEVAGGIVHLYNGAGTPIAGAAYVFLHGNAVDVTVGAAGVPGGTDAVEGPHGARATTMTFVCGASCNPSREFILATSGAGTNVTGWGIFVQGTGITRTSGSEGSAAGVLATRQFSGGATAHASTGSNPHASLRGLDVGLLASHAVTASSTFAGGFIRFNGPDPVTMTLQTPTTTAACPCGVLAGAPGTYTFRYDNAAPTTDESYAIWADVTLT